MTLFVVVLRDMVCCVWQAWAWHVSETSTQRGVAQRAILIHTGNYAGYAYMTTVDAHSTVNKCRMDLRWRHSLILRFVLHRETERLGLPSVSSIPPCNPTFAFVNYRMMIDDYNSISKTATDTRTIVQVCDRTDSQST